MRLNKEQPIKIILRAGSGNMFPKKWQSCRTYYINKNIYFFNIFCVKMCISPMYGNFMYIYCIYSTQYIYILCVCVWYIYIHKNCIYTFFPVSLEVGWRAGHILCVCVHVWALQWDSVSLAVCVQFAFTSVLKLTNALEQDGFTSGFVGFYQRKVSANE